MYKLLTKIVTGRLVMKAILGLVFLLYVMPVYAATITTITVKELDGVTTPSYPLTFGMSFKQGDVTGDVYLNSYPTQTDVKTTWADGSIKFAVVSALVPMSANQDTVLSVNTTGTAAPTTPISKIEMLATDIGATIDLSGLSGSGYSGNLQADLRAQITAASSFDYWLSGGVVSEILIKQPLNTSLDASWEARFYPGTSYIRISHSIENMKVSSRGNIDYALDIKQGNAAPASVFTKASFQHNHSSRWRKVFWLGSEPPEVEIHYDIDYWVSTGLIMPYDTSLVVKEQTIADWYADWLSRPREMMGTDAKRSGQIIKSFGATGGRPEIGVLPKWSALYLLSMDNRIRETVLGNAELSANIATHFMEDNATRGVVGSVINIDDYPYALRGGAPKVPAAIGDLTTTWSPDVAHQGSFSYLPYLITGERFFLDEIYSWAGWILARDSYRRDGDCGKQNFASKIGDGTAANGIIYDQERAMAWGLRNLSDASQIAPDADTREKAYFASKVENNIDWLTLGNAPGSTAQGFHAVRVPRQTSVNSWQVIAPWMHDFIVLVLEDITRKKTIPNISKAAALRDVLGSFTVERFNHSPDFPKFNAAGYWWPLSGIDEAYYSAVDWATYWLDVSAYRNEDPITSIKTDFTGSDYAFSYAAIARGAVSRLTHLKNGASTYSFLNTSLSYFTWAPTDPTWAFVPLVKPPGGLLREN